MKKVLVIGCKGMAGHVIKTYLESLNNYQVIGIARNVNSNKNLFNLDVSDTNKLEQILKESSFDIVINCIGLLNKTAEDNPE
jgi:dTDP-4-dehydrorhamnose reductase